MKTIYRHTERWRNSAGRRLPQHVVKLCEGNGKFFLVNAQTDTNNDGEDAYGTFEVDPEQAFAFATEVGCLDRRLATLMMGVPEDTQWVSEPRRTAR